MIPRTSKTKYGKFEVKSPEKLKYLYPTCYSSTGKCNSKCKFCSKLNRDFTDMRKAMVRLMRKINVHTAYRSWTILKIQYLLLGQSGEGKTIYLFNRMERINGWNYWHSQYTMAGEDLCVNHIQHQYNLLWKTFSISPINNNDVFFFCVRHSSICY